MINSVLSECFLVHNINGITAEVLKGTKWQKVWVLVKIKELELASIMRKLSANQLMGLYKLVDIYKQCSLKYFTL